MIPVLVIPHQNHNYFKFSFSFRSDSEKNIIFLRVVISSYNEDSDYSLGQKSAKIKHQSLFRCIFVRFLKIFVLYPALYLFLGTFHHTEYIIRGGSAV